MDELNPHDLYVFIPCFHNEALYPEIPIFVIRLDTAFFAAIDAVRDSAIEFYKTTRFAAVSLWGYSGDFVDAADLQQNPEAGTIRDQLTGTQWEDTCPSEFFLKTEADLAVFLGADLMRGVSPAGEAPEGIRTDVDRTALLVEQNDSGEYVLALQFSALVKHTDIVLETYAVPYDELRRRFLGHAKEAEALKAKETSDAPA